MMPLCALLKRSLLLVLACTAPVCAWAVPVFEGVPVTTTAGTTGNVTPTIPIAKALLLPVSVYDSDSTGAQPAITVTSSNPNIMVRVRTGNPALVMKLDYAGTTGTDTAYSGDLVFQLFQDWTPLTAAYVRGFANFGLYDSRKIFRIQDLGSSAFIYQGGSVTDTNQGTVGFTFDNEFKPPLIFAGRGQLAMANAGFPAYNRTINSTSYVDAPGNYHGTNGSQFFITDGQPRHLDFRHTIMAQLTHGWPLLDKLKNTPVYADDVTDSSGNVTTPAATPKTAVKVVSTTVVPKYSDGTHVYTDAVLVLTATAPGKSVITLKAGATTATFTATAQKDTVNDHPFFQPTDDFMTKAEALAVPYKAVDLERDFIEFGGNLVNPYSTSTISLKASLALDSQYPVLHVTGAAKYRATSTSTAGPYVGPLYPYLTVSQLDSASGSSSYDISPRVVTTSTGGVAEVVDDYFAPEVILGVQPITLQPVSVTATAGTALTAANLGGFVQPDAHAAAITATINWGDSTHTAAAATVTRSTSAATFGTYTVTNTDPFTYANAGVYPITITLTSATGWTRELISTAYVTAGTLNVIPTSFTNVGALVNNRILATFTDTAAGSPAADYTASIDWGDGAVSVGSVRSVTATATTASHFAVYGTHTYRDPEAFTVSVTVKKAGLDATQAVSSFGRLLLSGFVGQQHLPPFNQAHLAAVLAAAPVDRTGKVSGDKAYRTILGDVTTKSQTYFTCALTILNSGNLPSQQGSVSMMLCKGLRPAAGDITLTFGPYKQTMVPIPALQPGQRASTLYFDYNPLGDYRLIFPPNETGSGYNLVAKITYGDPLVPYEPIDFPTIGRLPGVIVTPQTVVTNETDTVGASTASTGTFQVFLLQRPTSNVTIPLTGDVTEGTITPSTLTFTPVNWHVPQTVKVKGITDSALPTATNAGTVDQAATQYAITIGPAQSSDLRYNGLGYNGIGSDRVTVTNFDRDSNITVSPATLTTTATLTRTDTGDQTTGTTGIVTLTLAKQPLYDVSVQVIIENSADGAIVANADGSPVVNPIVFKASEYATVKSKTFTVQGVPDTSALGTAATGTGKVSYQIAFLASSVKPDTAAATAPATDVNFDGITPKTVTVTNTTTVTSTVTATP